MGRQVFSVPAGAQVLGVVVYSAATILFLGMCFILGAACVGVLYPWHPAAGIGGLVVDAALAIGLLRLVYREYRRRASAELEIDHDVIRFTQVGKTKTIPLDDDFMATITCDVNGQVRNLRFDHPACGRVLVERLKFDELLPVLQERVDALVAPRLCEALDSDEVLRFRVSLRTRLAWLAAAVIFSAIVAAVVFELVTGSSGGGWRGLRMIGVVGLLVISIRFLRLALGSGCELTREGVRMLGKPVVPWSTLAEGRLDVGQAGLQVIDGLGRAVLKFPVEGQNYLVLQAVLSRRLSERH